MAGAQSQLIEGGAVGPELVGSDHPVPVDAHHHLVEVPVWARLGQLQPKPLSELWSELQGPVPDRFLGDLKATLSQEPSNVAIAQREPKVKPDGLLNDHGRKSVTGIGDRRHHIKLPHCAECATTRPCFSVLWPEAPRSRPPQTCSEFAVKSVLVHYKFTRLDATRCPKNPGILRYTRKPALLTS